MFYVANVKVKSVIYVGDRCRGLRVVSQSALAVHCMVAMLCRNYMHSSAICGQLGVINYRRFVVCTVYHR